VNGHTRRSLVAAAGTALTGVLAGCSGLRPLSNETDVEYDDSALAEVPGDLPRVPAAIPVQPTTAHLDAARDRLRSLLDGTAVERVPNAAVRERLARERASAREALSQETTDTQPVDALAGLTYPRSEAMFVHAGLAAFDGDLDTDGLATRRDRHQRVATAFLDDYRYVGPPDASVATLAEHARIVDWARTGRRLLGPPEHAEYRNTVLHAAELAQGIEWGRAYADDARRLHTHHLSTLDDTRDYGDLFTRAADELVDALEPHTARPDLEALPGEFERDIEQTPAADLVEALARRRWSHAQSAVEDHEAGREALAVVAAVAALTAARAFTAATDAVEAGAYGVPESVEPIAAERTAAVEGLQTLLDSSPPPLARWLASQVASQIRRADDQIRRPVTPPERYLYVEYALGHLIAAAAPPVVERVGAALDA
jgi:hypothetical protein